MAKKKWSSEIVKQFMFLDGNHYHILYKCKSGAWFRTSTGGFGQRDLHIIYLEESEAKALIKIPTPA